MQTLIIYIHFRLQINKPIVGAQSKVRTQLRTKQEDEFCVLRTLSRWRLPASQQGVYVAPPRYKMFQLNASMIDVPLRFGLKDSLSLKERSTILYFVLFFVRFFLIKVPSSDLEVTPKPLNY